MFVSMRIRNNAKDEIIIIINVHLFQNKKELGCSDGSVVMHKYTNAVKKLQCSHKPQPDIKGLLDFFLLLH